MPEPPVTNLKLYHASDNPNIEIFEPRAESRRDPEEGPVVFATPDPAYASCFIVKATNDWYQISSWGEEYPWVYICSDKTRFETTDKGGAIYELPTKTFYVNPKYSTGDSEWVSKESVKPVSKEIYSSGLDAMLQHSVQVFFVDSETYKLIREDTKLYGLKIVLKLQDEGKSVNQLQKKNYLPAIPDGLRQRRGL